MPSRNSIRISRSRTSRRVSFFRALLFCGIRRHELFPSAILKSISEQQRECLKFHLLNHRFSCALTFLSAAATVFDILGSDMNCFVTGASGFIGANLVHELASRGHHVRALLRKESDLRGLAGAPYEPVRGDVVNAEALAAGL